MCISVTLCVSLLLQPMDRLKKDWSISVAYHILTWVQSIISVNKIQIFFNILLP